MPALASSFSALLIHLSSKVIHTVDNFCCKMWITVQKLGIISRRRIKQKTKRPVASANTAKAAGLFLSGQRYCLKTRKHAAICG